MLIRVSFVYLRSNLEEHILHIFYVENITGVLSVVRWDVSMRKGKLCLNPSTSMDGLLNICENKTIIGNLVV
jgi:hypothetical protein